MTPATSHLIDVIFGGCFLAAVLFFGGFSVGYQWGYDKASRRARQIIEDAGKKYNTTAESWKGK